MKVCKKVNKGFIVSIAFFCILLMGLLPYVLAGLAKFGGKEGFDNHAPRVALSKLVGWRQRANWAQANQFEALPLFVAAVLVATYNHAPEHTLNILAISVVILRVVYSSLYILDKASLRSLVWFAGIGCTVAMFFI